MICIRSMLRKITYSLALAWCACFTLPLQAASGYQQDNLVSDVAVPDANTDLDLVNPWGIAFNPNGVVWVADNGTGKSTLYDGNGTKQGLIVTIRPSTCSEESHAKPTGIVFNSSDDFAVSNGTTPAPSRFIFATEDGAIAVWAPTVDLNNAITKVDVDNVEDCESKAIYKGLALGADGTHHLLYATDFHNGKIDVFDKDFQLVNLPGGFTDPSIPDGFAPFGIQNLNGDIYVTYAKQDEEGEDDVAGKGLGFVNVFDANGHLIRHTASPRGKLNAPWGLAIAPAGFGKLSNRLLVGNFGDGTINAFDIATGRFVGRVRGEDGRPLQIDGLWGISFGSGVNSQPTNTLFFAAGPEDETHGLYGRIDPASGDDSGSQDIDLEE